MDTKDLADLAWSPDGRVLCVWDSLLRVSYNCTDIVHDYYLATRYSVVAFIQDAKDTIY